ncbi:MAG: hypothetical protein WBC85_05790 [Planktotalea sp.]|uniref:hypothetical protein n=1 Tax=Planktotalea sp. TaxID=2029877 RepID=UPI003C77BD3C
MKTIIFAGLLAVCPVMSLAMCSDGHKAAMSCATDSAWDADKQACLPIASS